MTNHNTELVGTPAPSLAAEARTRRLWRWLVAVVRSFGYAFSGIGQMIRTQRNAQIHVLITAAACVAAWAWGLSRLEWVALILTIGLVLGMEAINTAVEAVVDLASPQYHPLAKRAKDIAAGAVLLVAIAAVCVGLLLFGPHALDLLLWLIR